MGETSMAKGEGQPRVKPKKRDDESAAEKPAARSPTLWITLGCGGLLVLSVCCTSIGAGAYFAFFSGPAIVGKWEMPNAFDQREWEFHRNGTGNVRITREPVPGKKKSSTAHFNYKLIEGEP